MSKQNLRFFNHVLPYTLIVSGVVLLLIFPLSFYSNGNLNLPTTVSQSIIKADNYDLPAMGGDVGSVGFPKSGPITPLPKKQEKYGAVLSSNSALAMDAVSRKILFAKNADQVRPLASITKLMSAIVLLGLPIDWSATTTIDSLDGGGDEHVKDGETFTLEDLWNISLVGSSNRAIMALARSAKVSEQGFVELMNKKAREFGLKSLNFSEPTGLSEKNVGNATDAANLLREALRFDKVYKTLQIGEYYARPLGAEKLRRVWSTNWLLTNWVPNSFDQKDIAGKTGYIPSSGYNLVVSLTGDAGHQVIFALLGASDNEKRFTEARDLAEWVFSNYLWPTDDGYPELTE